MEPLEATSIMRSAVQSVAILSRPEERAEPAKVDRQDVASEAERRPAEGEAPSLMGPSESSSQIYTAPVAGDPVATIAKAEELIQTADTGQPTSEDLRIAADAYIMEIQAQRDWEKMQTEGPSGMREWFA